MGVTGRSGRRAVLAATGGLIATIAGCSSFGRDPSGSADPSTPTEADPGPDTTDSGGADGGDNPEMEEDAGSDGGDTDDRFDWEFEGFTHLPVDFDALLTGIDALDVKMHKPLTPYAFHAHGHVEGPRKWYLYDHDTPPHEPVSLPARGIYETWVVDGLADAERATVDGEPVLVDVGADFHLSSTVSVFFMHLALREAIVEQARESGDEYIVLDAGTHIGYMYYPPWNSVDFGVRDTTHDAGMAADPENQWNHLANPLDYFTDTGRETILAAYEPLYRWYVEEGVHPFTDLTDSRANVNIAGTLGGVWFLDELDDPFHDMDTQWGMLNFMDLDHVHAETYWRVLDHPWNRDNGFAGLFTEKTGERRPDPAPYAGDPLGTGSRFYLLDGSLSDGVAMIVRDWEWDPLEPDSAENHPAHGEQRYLRFRVDSGETVHGDSLRLQGFDDESSARAGFTGDGTWFRRDPDRAA